MQTQFNVYPLRTSSLPQGAQDLRWRRALSIHEKSHAERLGPGPQGPTDAQDQQDQMWGLELAARTLIHSIGGLGENYQTFSQLLLGQSFRSQETLENVVHHFHGLMAQSQHEYPYLTLFDEVVDLPKVEIMGEDDAPFALG
jgi:hypothetical protein